MIELWYSILVLMTGLYLVMDGWNIGAGAVHFTIGKHDIDRRTIISAIGPFWIWHEVWLVGTGGVMMLAFPVIMSTFFSGFYLAFMLLLWALIGRGIAIEFAGHIQDRMWRNFWDVVFAFSNILLAILFGLALGNLIRGVPLGPDGTFTLSFFTHFGADGNVGIIDLYTISVAVFLFTCLTAHGASYVALRTEGEINSRSRQLAGTRWVMTFVLFLIVTGMTWFVRQEVLLALLHCPIAWPLVALVVIGSMGVFTGLRHGKELRTFLGGCAVIFGLIGAGAVGIFPTVLRSTISPEYSINAYQGGAYPGGLILAIFWWPVSFLLAVGYMVYIARFFTGKVNANGDQQQYGTASGILPEDTSFSFEKK